MAKVVNLEKYRRCREPIVADKLPNTVCLVVQFKDTDKLDCHYEVTGRYDKSRIGRIVLAEALLSVVEDLLEQDNSDVLLQVSAAFRLISSTEEDLL